MFSEDSVMNDKIDKLSSLIGKLATQAIQNRESRPFKPIVYEGRGRPQNNFSSGDQRFN